MFEIQQFLACPECHSRLAFSDNRGTAKCPGCDFLLIKEDLVWMNAAHSDSQPQNYYQNIDYDTRLNTPYTTTKHEGRNYFQLVDEVCRNFSKDSLLMDLGCGDGRLSRFLLSLGFRRILSIDLDSHNLRRLSSRLSDEEKSRIVMLQADCTRLPLAPFESNWDGIFALGLFNIFHSRIVEICAQLHNLLSPEGYLINTDPTLEGSLLYALIRQDMEEFCQVALTRTKSIDYDNQRSRRYPVFADGEMETLLAKANLGVIRTRGISVLPSLVFGGIFQMKSFSENQKAEIARRVDELADQKVPVYRVKMYISQKRAISHQQND